MGLRSATDLPSLGKSQLIIAIITEKNGERVYSIIWSIPLTDTETGFISTTTTTPEYSVGVIRLEHHARMTMIQCQS